MSGKLSGRVPDGTGLSQAEPSGLGPPGFDPSRERTALSYWFPKVEAAGLPVPKTVLLPMPDDAHEAILTLLWNGEADLTPAEAFLRELRAACEAIGFPVFLRTDHTSGKHDWRRTCFVPSAEDLGAHVCGIAEFSECNGMFGELPWSSWAVREMLPTIPVGVCPRFGDMPVCKEFRFFVDGGMIECFHPYWPREALEQGGCHLSDTDYAALCTPEDEGELRRIASRAGAALGGRWSVDLLATERGWFLTDMAEAEKSYHWPECVRDSDGSQKGGDAEGGSVACDDSAGRQASPEHSISHQEETDGQG